MNKDSNLNKNGEKMNFNWPILFIISLSSIITGIYREGFASLFPFLQRNFNLTRAQLGLHSTFFFFTSALAAVFVGRLVDLKGSKWGLFFGVFFTGIFLILHSMVPNFIILLVLASFTGLAVSINIPASSKAIIKCFPQKWRNIALGIQSTAYPIGGIFGAIFLPFLGGLFGWRKTILIPGILALMYAFFILHLYQNKRKGNLKKNDVNSISLWKNFNKLIKNIDLIPVVILGFFLAAIGSSIAVHFTLFLYLDYGLTEKIAGLGFAVLQFGSILGRVGWSLVCDRILGGNKRKTFLYIGLLFTFLSLILSLFLRNFNLPIGALFLLAFLIGCSGRGWEGLFYAYIAETVKEEDVGIAMGFSLFLMRLGAVLTPPIFGYIADLRGAYDFSWLLLGLMMFLTSVGQYIYYIKTQKSKESIV